jgi:probable 2-oxoglutarate dehydrogenase E1 component DHKTD1
MYIDGRMKKIEEGTNIDWSTAEAMAIGSLLMQGFMCRISGQDVGMTRNFEDKVTAS